jgi:hypothetical protein
LGANTAATAAVGPAAGNTPLPWELKVLLLPGHALCGPQWMLLCLLCSQQQGWCAHRVMHDFERCCHSLIMQSVQLLQAMLLILKLS